MAEYKFKKNGQGWALQEIDIGGEGKFCFLNVDRYELINHLGILFREGTLTDQQVIIDFAKESEIDVVDDQDLLNETVIEVLYEGSTNNYFISNYPDWFKRPIVGITISRNPEGEIPNIFISGEGITSPLISCKKLALLFLDKLKAAGSIEEQNYTDLMTDINQIWE